MSGRDYKALARVTATAYGRPCGCVIAQAAAWFAGRWPAPSCGSQSNLERSVRVAGVTTRVLFRSCVQGLKGLSHILHGGLVWHTAVANPNTGWAAPHC